MVKILNSEQLVLFAFKIISQLSPVCFKAIIDNFCLADYTLCIVEFAESIPVSKIKYCFH